MLIDGHGRVIAASWFDSTPTIGDLVDSDVVTAALQGKSTWSINNNVILQGQVLDVAVPVNLNARRVLGVVRLSHNLQEIQRRLAPLRGLVWLMLGLGATLVPVARPCPCAIRRRTAASLGRGCGPLSPHCPP